MGFLRKKLQRKSRDDEDIYIVNAFEGIIREMDRGNPHRRKVLLELRHFVEEEPYLFVNVAEQNPLLMIKLMNEAFVVLEGNTLRTGSTVSKMRRKVDREIKQWVNGKQTHIREKIFQNNPRFVNGFKKRNQNWVDKTIEYLIKEEGFDEFSCKLRRLRYIDNRILKNLDDPEKWKSGGSKNDETSYFTGISSEQSDKISELKNKLSDVDSIAAEKFEGILLKDSPNTPYELVAWEAIANTYEEVLETYATYGDDHYDLEQHTKEEIYKTIIKTSQYRLTEHDFDEIKLIKDSKIKEIEQIYEIRFEDLAFNKSNQIF